MFSAISDHPVVRDVLKEGVEDTLRNVVRLSFTFEELNKQEIMEEPKWAVQDLLAAIGGSMGMYVGISLVTMCEIFDFALDSLWNWKNCCASTGRSLGGVGGSRQLTTP